MIQTSVHEHIQKKTSKIHAQTHTHTHVLLNA